jgi:transcriptional regulator with XRE-family HTH domain
MDAEQPVNARQRTTLESRSFGTWLKRSREARRLGSKELAEKCGLARGVITELEQGTLRPNRAIDVYVRVAKGLELELGFVLYKAGFDMGESGLNMERLQRTEEIIELLGTNESRIRRAIAEGMEGFNIQGNYPLAERLGDALGKFDLVTERLREGRQT